MSETIEISTARAMTFAEWWIINYADFVLSGMTEHKMMQAAWLYAEQQATRAALQPILDLAVSIQDDTRGKSGDYYITKHDIAGLFGETARALLPPAGGKHG